jgi:hypothetical protein
LAALDANLERAVLVREEDKHLDQVAKKHYIQERNFTQMENSMRGFKGKLCK